MKILRSILSVALIAVIVVGGIYAYRSCSLTGCDATKNLIQSKTAVLKADNTKNPYEDPNDPNTTSNGTTFSTNTITGYYLDLDLGGMLVEMDVDSYYLLRDNGLTNFFSTSNYTFTAVITFPNTDYNGLPVCITAPINCTIPREGYVMWRWVIPELGLNNGFHQVEGNSIRLPASYYNFLKWEEENKGIKACGKVKFVFTYNGNQSVSTKGTYSCNYKLYTKDIPEDSDDPVSPNFDLGAFGGLMSQIKEGCGAFTLGDWIMTILFIILLLGAVSLITTIIKKV